MIWIALAFLAAGCIGAIWLFLRAILKIMRGGV